MQLMSVPIFIGINLQGTMIAALLLSKATKIFPFSTLPLPQASVSSQKPILLNFSIRFSTLSSGVMLFSSAITGMR